MKKMNVIVKEAQGKNKLVTLDIKKDDTLTPLQRLVDGYIDSIPISKLNDRNIDIIINDEGKLNGLEPNIAFCSSSKKEIVDVVVGTIVFVGVKEADYISLNDEQIEFINNNLYEKGLHCDTSTGYIEVIAL